MARRRLALFLLCLASFMAVVDNTIVTIALPSMRRELGFSGADAGWVLFVNVPVALVALLMTPLAVPESRGEDVPRVLDVPGAATVTLGVAATIYAVTKVSEGSRASILVFGVAGVLLLVCFVAAERRSAAPLVPLGVVMAGSVVFPNAAIFLQSMIGLS